MEETFDITWDEAGTAVVNTEEEVISMENEILQEEETDYTEEVVEESVDHQDVQVDNNGIMYITDADGNVLVMEQGEDGAEYQEYMQVGEEVVTDQWGESCPEEIVIGGEEAVGGGEEQTAGEVDIPLPDQDEYTTARPYPCDFCSRRFRKKANLMNHMVAHQTDRPHGCNLCGVRYIRKCDLMNHLKTHAYIPENDEDTEEAPEDSSSERTRRRGKYVKKKQPVSSRQYDEEDGSYGHMEEEDASAIAGSSRGDFNYAEEDVRIMEEIENQYLDEDDEEDHPDNVEVIRYEITDPRKPFVCQHCGVGFAREKALASHSMIHGGDSPFECQKCGEMFWNAALMKEHMKAKHAGKLEDFLDDDDDEDEDYSEEDVNAKYGTFYCQTCGMSFHRQDNLRRHQRVHLKEEYVNDHEFSHICNVCGESFHEALDLLAHAEVHARGNECRCMICGELFPDDSAVEEHVAQKHGRNLPPNTCMLCGRTCKDRKSLLKHSWEHSKEKLFACSKCTKTFHNKARLKRHMLSHRNKVVNCDVCGEEFPDGRSLMNHRHSHSSVSGRQFACRECGKTFGSRSSQQIHIRIHTGERPYGCRYCWKAFADGGTLRKHERIHTGEKPYACAVCPRAFNQRVVLREHIRSHHSGPDPKYTNSMTPYCCAVCSDMFTTSQDLILHLIHHCDMNTAMKRQPQVGPRKYKRRTKLKPHELELMSRPEEVVQQQQQQEHQEDGGMMTAEEEDQLQEPRRARRQKKSPRAAASSMTESEIFGYQEQVPKASPTKAVKRKFKVEGIVPSRPKMIHTQKTRVPMDAGDDGKVRHRTRTLVTRTEPTELRSSTGERIRPRTKNVSYHSYTEKLPLATFPVDDTESAVSNLLKENMADSGTVDNLQNGLMDYMDQLPEVASEQTVVEEEPLQEFKVRRSGRHILTPGSKVRLVKGGMLVSKKKRGQQMVEEDLDEIVTTFEVAREEIVKEEPLDMMEEPSPLHELAEISMQHAKRFQCEMCSEVFSDRAQLLVHVPIHI